MTDSWWLKLDRAEHHLKEVERYIAKYSKAHKYEAVRGADLKEKGVKIARYYLRIDGEPDERLSVVVGDVVHNVRSALDHLVTSIAPNRDLRSKIAFSIFAVQPYDNDGHPLDTDDGKRWANLQRALPPEALAKIDLIQPFKPATDEVLSFCEQQGLTPADVHGFVMLSKLDNADKHRKLIVVAQGLSEAVVTITSPNGDSVNYLLGAPTNGTEIAAVKVEDSAHSSQVTVQIDGVPMVAIEVGKGKPFRLPISLKIMIAEARELAESLSEFTS